MLEIKRYLNMQGLQARSTLAIQTTTYWKCHTRQEDVPYPDVNNVKEGSHKQWINQLAGSWVFPDSLCLPIRAILVWCPRIRIEHDKSESMLLLPFL